MKMLGKMTTTVREMRTCREMGKWLQHYLDGELDGPTSEQVQDHLLTCVRCGLEFDTYERIVDALHETADESPALITDEVAVERLRRFAEELASPSGE